jgi:peptidoglycan/LPS O-acetylase OafA/YrhL
MLHSLNALRVIAEFFVVHLHVTTFRLGGCPWIYDVIARDLMSFFFVLSGFVAAWTHPDDNAFSVGGSGYAYLSRRLAKVYPLYLLNTFIWAVLASVHQTCAIFYICSFMDFILLGGWSMCYHVEGNVKQGWYIEALVWMWASFPFIHRYILRRVDNMGMIFLMWIMSMGISGVLIAYPEEYANLRCFPAARILEFTMGCGTARMARRAKPMAWIIYLALCAAATMYVVDYTVSRYSLVVCAKQGSIDSTCVQFPNITYTEPQTIPCFPVWDLVMSRYALMWAGLLWYCAHHEMAGTPVPFLQWDLFKTLSDFSLQLYLCHWLLAELLLQIEASTGVWFLQLDTIMIAIYLLSWLFKKYLQGYLDACGKRLFERRVLVCAEKIPLQMGD